MNYLTIVLVCTILLPIVLTPLIWNPEDGYLKERRISRHVFIAMCITSASIISAGFCFSVYKFTLGRNDEYTLATYTLANIDLLGLLPFSIAILLTLRILMKRAREVGLIDTLRKHYNWRDGMIFGFSVLSICSCIISLGLASLLIFNFPQGECSLIECSIGLLSALLGVYLFGFIAFSFIAIPSGIIHVAFINLYKKKLLRLCS